MGGSRHHSGQARAASADRAWFADAVRAVRSGVVGDRDPDGVTAAGAECVRDRAAIRGLDRAGVGRRAAGNVRVGGDADQCDVGAEDRPDRAAVALMRSGSP